MNKIFQTGGEPMPTVIEILNRFVDEINILHKNVDTLEANQNILFDEMMREKRKKKILEILTGVKNDN